MGGRVPTALLHAPCASRAPCAPRALVVALLAFVALAAALAVAPSARAQSTTAATPRSGYEEYKLESALRRAGRALEPDPEDKIVEDVDVVALEVIEVDDPAPRLLNVFHTTTRTSVLKREVLLRPGERYRQYRVDETVRALRSFQQLSLVLAVAVKGSAPDRVRVLLVTKDVWSLRTQFDIKMGAGGLDLLRFEPTERNLGGSLDSAITRFELLPETVTLGAAYLAPRFSSRRLYLNTEANVVFSRETGQPEGSFGRFAATTPQLSADTPLVGGYSTVWVDTFVRRYVGARLATFDAASTPEAEAVPDKFRTRQMTQTASVVRSFGRADKVDLTLGAELSVRQYTGLDPAVYDARVVADYARKRVPTSDDRAAPFVQVRAYESRFLRIHDFDLLGLQEDYRVGYDAWLRAYPVTRALGSTRSFLGVAAVAQYVLPLRDGMIRSTNEAVVEVTLDDVPTLELAGNVQIVAPRLPFGRLVVDVIAIARPQNYLNHRSGIGGEGRLRGYPSAAFLGENLVAYNAELRTRPVEILACQIGAAAFFDVGDAFDGTDVRLKSSAGVGLRGLLPQLDRKVMRLDVAFPMVRGANDGPVGFYIAFEQAFPSGATTPPGAAASQSILNPLGGALQ